MQDYSFYIVSSYAVAGAGFTLYLLATLLRFFRQKKRLKALKQSHETKA